MSMLDKTTVLILTYNEEANIGRTLEAVKWARHILIIDSGSTDRTREIAGAHPQVEVLVRPFDSHQAQWQYGLDQCPADLPWVLALDADYQVTPELRDEIAALSPGADDAGYRVRFRYRLHRKVLRASLYPAVVALYRRSNARYVQEGHTQRIIVDGRVLDLQHAAVHDDRKPLSRWVASQQRYAALEARHLLDRTKDRATLRDRIRLMAWPAPLLVFAYTLFAKRCILDGRAGLLYAFQRLLAETMIAIEVTDRRQSNSQQRDVRHPAE